VHVGIDQARYNDFAAPIDDFGIGGSNIAANSCNPVTVNQEVACSDIAETIVHGQDRRRPDQGARHVLLPSGSPCQAPLRFLEADRKFLCTRLSMRA
jgi:hypothetical protein